MLRSAISRRSRSTLPAPLLQAAHTNITGSPQHYYRAADRRCPFRDRRAPRSSRSSGRRRPSSSAITTWGHHYLGHQYLGHNYRWKARRRDGSNEHRLVHTAAPDAPEGSRKKIDFFLQRCAIASGSSRCASRSSRSSRRRRPSSSASRRTTWTRSSTRSRRCPRRTFQFFFGRGMTRGLEP